MWAFCSFVGKLTGGFCSSPPGQSCGPRYSQEVPGKDTGTQTDLEIAFAGLGQYPKPVWYFQ